MEEAGIPVEGEDCILLGAGGAAKAAAWTLGSHGARAVYILNRSGERAEALLSRMTPAAQKAALVCCALLAAGVFAALYLFPLILNLF